MTTLAHCSLESSLAAALSWRVTTSRVLLDSRSCFLFVRDPIKNCFFARGCGGMTYLESLTNAEDDREATVNGKLGLAGNELVQC